ncbi:MAG: 23S rRNA (uracil(1939)-C(5))-methyltransferase RlmD [Candidatus Acidiferrales bacterium]
MEITIEKLIYGGEGLAHHDGSTVFVPFVLPAERISAAPVEQKKKFIRARVERLLEPSPERAAARCPHFGVCGGCDYQHIPYDAQLKFKTEILRETLRRIGRIEWPGEITAHASPPWGYRNRAQWKVRPLGEDGVGGTGIGYFRANSSALCAVEDCSILSPLLLKTLLALRAAAAAGALPRELREIEAFAGAADSKLLVTATFAGFPPRAQELVEKFRATLPEIESLLFHDPTRERMELDGPGFVECEAAGSTYRVGHFSFFQVNRFLADELVRQVVDSEDEGRLALDLFAGVGLFSVPLAKRFARVVAVEANPAAARDLETNTSGRVARSGRVIEVRAADVEQFLQKMKEKPDLVLLDPPRAGLTPGTVKHLARIAPARITYVSCDPPTLARDLAAFVKSGYDISTVHLFDLFPQTFHMEAVVGLRRRP